MIPGPRMCVVCMPFASLAHAALGASLVQAVARASGFACDLEYLNLRLAGELGFDVYNALGELSPPTALVGDWVFAHLVDERVEARADLYVRDVLLGDHESYFSPDVTAEVLRIRDRASAFLDECLAGRAWEQYSIVGFTTSFQQNCASLALARRLKQRHPQIQIVFGGANCEGEMGIALHRRHRFLDYVVSGEAELVLPHLLAAVAQGRRPASMPGLIVREGERTLRPERMVLPVERMDELPVPDLSDYYEQLERSGLDTTFDPLVPFETARGCWWGAKQHCTFCGLNGHTMTFRSKSPERALSELRGQLRWGRRFLVVDNILDYRYFRTFLPELASQGIGASFHYEIKANLQPWQVDVLRAAGVDHVQPGIESLSTPILELMRKGTTRLQNLLTLRLCREAGIEVAWNLLFGFPGEDAAEYAEVLRLLPLLHHLDAPGFCGRVRVDRHSPYFTTPASFGIHDLRPMRAYSFVYDGPPEDLLDLAYYFDFEHEWRTDPATYAADLERAAGEWRADTRSRLTLEACGSRVRIEDRRRGSSRSFEFDGLHARLLCDCREIRTREALARSARQDSSRGPCSDAELDEALERLVDLGLLVREGEKFLTLALFPLEAGAAGRPAPSQQFLHPIREHAERSRIAT